MDGETQKMGVFGFVKSVFTLIQLYHLYGVMMHFFLQMWFSNSHSPIVPLPSLVITTPTINYIFMRQLVNKEKGKTFNQIAEWLNGKGYLSVRGKKFRGAHVHSIVKKKRLKDEKLER